MTHDEIKKADATVVTTTGVSAVSVGAPLLPAKAAVAALGGKGAVVAVAAKSAVVMGAASAAAPVVFLGAAAYGLWRLLDD